MIVRNKKIKKNVFYQENRLKQKAFKDKDYLEYMHNSEKYCFVCENNLIELHHIKTRRFTADGE